MFKKKLGLVIIAALVVTVLSSPGITYAEEFQLLTALNSPTPQHGGYFGRSVAVHGSLVVIGEDNRNIGAGMVHIYDVDSKTMTSITSPTPEANARFGWSVAVYGNLVVIGEPYRNTDGVSNSGLVHIYDVNSGTITSIKPPNPQNMAIFGSSVAVYGDLVVIGEPWRNIDPAGNEGMVYIYIMLKTAPCLT